MPNTPQTPEVPADAGRRAALQKIVSEFSLAFAYLVSAMPSGVLAVVLASTPAGAVARDYARQNHHGRDRTSWRAIAGRRVLRATEAGKDSKAAVWRSGARHNHEQVAAAPVDSTMFDGYPGALVVGRTGGEFSDDELAQIEQSASQLSLDRPTADAADVNAAFLVIDDSGIPLLNHGHSQELLASSRQQFADLAAALRGDDTAIAVRDRWTLQLSTGVLVPYRAVRYREYPALSDAPVTLLARAPGRADWSALTTESVGGDTELARLIPAIHLMVNDFARQPTLHELAAAVNLSPFHFHRVFSEVTGTTPKHLMLDCQIELAKQELRDGKKNMFEIAEACGFAHQSHFTSRFKQVTGVTPTAWRRLAGDGAV